MLFVKLCVTLFFVVSYAADGSGNETCSSKQFTCADGRGCVNLSYRCDGETDCADGSDELPILCRDNCTGIAARFQCGFGTCIRKINVCDGVVNCIDGSDEVPELCSENCGGIPDRFQCSNRRCLPKDRVCNGHDNCGDNSDESSEICIACNGNKQQLKCRASSKCVSFSSVCNGFNDCSIRDGKVIVTEDKTDESNCEY